MINDIELNNYFKNKLIKNGSGDQIWCFVPTWYDGTEIHDEIIEKYKVGDFEPTHFVLNWLEFPKTFLVKILYRDGFGASIKDVSEYKEIIFKVLGENGQSNG